MDALLRELFTTDAGIMSLLAILGVLAIGAYMGVWIRRRMDEDSRRR